MNLLNYLVQYHNYFYGAETFMQNCLQMHLQIQYAIMLLVHLITRYASAASFALDLHVYYTCLLKIKLYKKVYNHI